MNRLFLKNKSYSLIIICISLFFFSFNHSTNKNSLNDPFTDICKNSDAYYLYNLTDVFYTKNWYASKRKISIKTKLVVNNTNGVDKNAFLKLSEFESNHLDKIKIRTLKADGSIIELDSSLVFQKKSDTKKFSAINYPIPAVEPGDTIESFYVYTEKLENSKLMNYVNFQADIPSIKSKYTIKTGSKLEITYKQYNNFPKPEIISNDTLIQLDFTMKNVKGLDKHEYNCIPCEIPYLYYNLENKKSPVRSWNDVYNDEFNFLTQPISLDHHRATYYKRWKRRTIGKAKDSSKYYKFKLLYNEVLNNFKMVNINRKEFIKSSGYFLKEKKFDPVSLRRFYRQILEDLNIDYWAVFGRSRLLGQIDSDYIRKGEFDHVFFAYINEKGFANFLYPHDEIHKYQINEIPTKLYSTKAVLVKPIYKEKKPKKAKFITRNLMVAKADSVSISTIKLPGMNSNYNYIQQTVSGHVNLKEKETLIKYLFKASGGLSTELRTFFSVLDKDKEASKYYNTLSKFEGNDNAIQIDTFTNPKLNRKKPFTYLMNGKGKLNNTITFINDSLVSISIDKLIDHNQLKSVTQNIDLNYYLDYSFSDNFVLYLNFPFDIEILGIKDGNINYKNKYGKYFFKIVKSKKNQLVLKSNYTINKNIIPKEDYKEIKQLNNKVTAIKSKRIIVKLKNTNN